MNLFLNNKEKGSNGNYHALTTDCKQLFINTRIVFYLVAISMFFFLTGCRNPFNPETVNPQDKDLTRGNTSPRNVLRNLETAYNTQDIDLFVSCLSDSFRFELLSVEKDEIGIDMDGDGIKDSWWDYTQEVEYHRNLFGSGSSDGTVPAPDNIFLNLQIPNEEFWQQDNQSGREDWIIIPVYFNLTLTLYGNSNITADGYARFHLKPEGNEWRIIIWRDESNI